MNSFLNFNVIKTLARRTFRQSVESPIAYVWGVLFYGFLGFIFAPDIFDRNQVSLDAAGFLAPWLLWFVIPLLTVGLLSEEIRSGTFEPLATWPVRDWEIVLGKYLGFCWTALIVIGGLLFYAVVLSFITDNPQGLDWGSTFGVIFGLYFLSLVYGAMGLYASSLAKNQVVVAILGIIFCTIFFLIGLYYDRLPGVLAQVGDFMGVTSHVNTLARGVWDFRDLFYFVSIIFTFLYLTAQRLSSRRF